MPADPHRQQELFEQALARPPDERSAFLDGACGDDRELRARVDRLLSALAAAGEFLADPEAAPDADCERPGLLIGRYKLLQQIGEGGFGTVWMAEQLEPVRRKVALKVIKLGMDTRQVVARFEQERQALALMEHPNIAKVLDGGSTESGRPFFVMELVNGLPITDYCDEAGLGTDERLGLFRQVCDAVQHAHQKGVIHRDLKPSNILVTHHGDTAVPKVIDFGVAKATSAELTQKTLFTEFRHMIGTPEYMAPEQAELSGLDVDTRADVYALGVLLYELLTGTKPFDAKELLERGYAEMLRVIREDEPPKPSTRVSTLGPQSAAMSSVRHTSPALLSRALRGDLDWIVMRALEKDRDRRYATANDLAADIGRHLRDELVHAGPPGAGYRLRKFARRNRAAVIAGSAVLGALVLGLAGTTYGVVQAREQATRATEAADRANVALEFVTETLKSSSPDVAGGRQEMTILAAMDKAVADIDSGRFEGHRATEAMLLHTIGLIRLGHGRGDEAERLVTRALDTRQELHPDGDPSVVRSLVALGSIRHQQGRTAEAEPLLQRALAMSTELHAVDHDDTALCLEHLGIVLQALLRADEAEPLFERAVKMNEGLHEGDHEAVASSLIGLGLARAARGHLAAAEEPLRQAQEMYERLHRDEDHPDVSTALGSLASVVQALRGPAEAEPLFERALEMDKRIYGPQGDHPRIARSLSNLGSVLGMQGRLEEAERYIAESKDMYERLCGGEDNADLARSLDNLAMVWQRLRGPAEAEPLYVRAYEMRTKLYPGDHPDVAHSLLGLAMVKSLDGRHAEAEPFFDQALQMNQRLRHDADDLEVAQGLCNLARVRQMLDRTADALDGYAKAIAMLRRLGPDDSREVAATLAQALCNSGAARLDGGDSEAALPELVEAEALAERLLPEGHPLLARCRAALATCRARLPK